MNHHHHHTVVTARWALLQIFKMSHSHCLVHHVDGERGQPCPARSITTPIRWTEFLLVPVRETFAKKTPSRGSTHSQCSHPSPPTTRDTLLSATSAALLGQLDAIHSRSVGCSVCEAAGNAACSKRAEARSRPHVERLHDNATAESMRIEILSFACLSTIHIGYRPLRPASARPSIVFPTLCYHGLSCPVMSGAVLLCKSMYNSAMARHATLEGLVVGANVACGKSKHVFGGMAFTTQCGCPVAVLRHVPLGQML